MVIPTNANYAIWEFSLLILGGNPIESLEFDVKLLLIRIEDFFLRSRCVFNYIYSSLHTLLHPVLITEHGVLFYLHKHTHTHTPFPSITILDMQQKKTEG